MSTKTYTLHATAGPLTGESYPVLKDSMNLGRASNCDIAIKDLLLSRTHCRFELRDSKLFVIDLASANETLVNSKAIDELELHHNDLIEVGESTFKVVTDPPEIVATGPGDATAGDDDVLIDLGFNSENDNTSDEKKSLLRPIIWIAAALLILVSGSTLIFNFANRDNQKPETRQIVRNDDLLIHYEKVEADTNNIFRYCLKLSSDGLLSAVIDDITGDRHIKKETKVNPALIKDLTRTINNSGFFSLEPKYSGYAETPGSMQLWKITITLGTKAYSCTVHNRVEPEPFKELRENLETFSKNELGIWAIQFSTGKLIKLAVEANTIADKMYAEMNVKYGNLYKSIKSYKEAVFYLETVDPKPDFYGTLVDKVTECEEELKKRYQNQRFKADRAINLKEWSTAVKELKILREMIPDRSDPRHNEAVNTLIDVENRL